MRCVSSVPYSFRTNDNVFGHVLPSRGPRQEDPLSPYLFVIFSQGLSSSINAFAEEGKIQGIRIARESPLITHLFFANDSLIFFKATSWDCENLKSYILLYEKASRQLVNYDKSSITFSCNTSPSNIQVIKDCLQLQVCQGHEVYLDLPTFTTWENKF